MKKIVFAQFPFPQYTLRNSYFNHLRNNLSAGYMLAAASARGELKKVRMEILNQEKLDLGGDAFILNEALFSGADALVLNLHPWNTLRSLYLARQAKKINPDFTVIGTGPEVSFNIYSFLLANGVDILIEGEPEASFCRAVEEIIKVGCRRGKIKYVYYKDTRPAPEKLPSFCEEGLLDAGYYRDIFWIETSSGCPYKCAYCYRWCFTPGGISYYPLEKVKKELILAKKYGKRLIKITDHTLNYSYSRLKDLSRVIRQADPGGQFVFQANLKAELVDKKTAELLDECNIRFIAAGLQSVNARPLKIANRKNETGLFLRGVNYLKQRNISVNPEIILGLPGETSSSICKTVDFLVENDLAHSTEAYILSVYPSTPLWDYAVKNKVKFQKRPPHLILETKTLPFNELRKAIDYAKENKCRIINEAISPSAGSFPLFTNYSNPRHFGNPRAEYKKCGGENIKLQRPFTKIIFGLNGFGRNNLSRINFIKNNIAGSVLVWFLSDDFDKDLPLAVEILKELSEANPYGIWHIAVDMRDAFSPNCFNELKKAVHHKPNCVDYQAVYLKNNHNPEYHMKSVQFYAIIEPALAKNKSSWLEDAKKYSKIILDININPERNYKKQITEAFKLVSDALLFDFLNHTGISFIKEILNFLDATAPREKEILFKNWIIQRQWLIRRQKEFYLEGAEENILLCGSGGMAVNEFDAEKLLRD